MKIVIAPDSFKESLSAIEVAQAVEKGWKKVFSSAEIVKVPMADGGEGTTQSLVDATNGKVITKTVTGPLGKPVEGFYGLLGGGESAVVEMAAAAGIHLVLRDERDPLITTTKGVGELILSALDNGVKEIILGLGGSATNDGGAGMVQALGVKLLDASGNQIGSGGAELANLDSIDISEIDPRLMDVKFIVACDVDNPLTGEKGASAVFGPQKGATPQMIDQLDRALGNYATKIETYLGIKVNDIQGTGAAGGLGAGVKAFLNAELKSGVDIVVEATNLSEAMQDADLVITGEGKIDSQTILGKTPTGVARTAKSLGIPVIGIAGCVSYDSDVVHDYGIDALFPVIPQIVSLDEALELGSENIERTARNIAKTYELGLKLK